MFSGTAAKDNQNNNVDHVTAAVNQILQHHQQIKELQQQQQLHKLEQEHKQQQQILQEAPEGEERKDCVPAEQQVQLCSQQHDKILEFPAADVKTDSPPSSGNLHSFNKHI